MKINRIFKIFILAIMMWMVLGMEKINALSISTNISDKYTEIMAGDRLYFEVDIKYPENPKRKDLRLNYEVTIAGEIIAQAQVLKAVETQASFLDFIVVPESSKTGFYNLKVKISDYEGLAEEVSSSFYVVEGKEQELKIYFFILLGVISLVAILVITNIVIVKRRNNQISTR